MHISAAQKRFVDQYYKELAAYKEQDVSHETAVRSAFQNLLANFAPAVNWMLIPEETLANGKRPDGTYQRGTRQKSPVRSGLLLLSLAVLHIARPNISRETVNEMPVQHLLTERLFRTIFNNPAFTRRKVPHEHFPTIASRSSGVKPRNSPFSQTAKVFPVLTGKNCNQTKNIPGLPKIFNMTHRQGKFPLIFPTPDNTAENSVICLSAIGASKSFHCQAVNCIPDLHLTGDKPMFPLLHLR